MIRNLSLTKYSIHQIEIKDTRNCKYTLLYNENPSQWIAQRQVESVSIVHFERSGSRGIRFRKKSYNGLINQSIQVGNVVI